MINRLHYGHRFALTAILISGSGSGKIRKLPYQLVERVPVVMNEEGIVYTASRLHSCKKSYNHSVK